MTGNNLESRPDRKSQPWDKRIPETNVVYVLAARLKDEFAARSVVSEELIENRKFDTRSRSDLAWSGSTFAVRGRFHKATDEPACKPSEGDLFRRGIRLPFERRGNRRQIGFVSQAEMLKTLSHAPAAGRRLPIELFVTKPTHQRVRALVICA